MKILIPMAGMGSRFVAHGIVVPKPLIDVEGKPMIERVVENLGRDNKFAFVIRRDTTFTSGLEDFLLGNFPGCEIFYVERLTRGAAETCLVASEWFDDDEGLVIANCDQLQVWDHGDYLQRASHTESDGLIVTFDSDHPNNSYVELSSSGDVARTVEKRVISRIATTGVYHWRRGHDFVECARRMIAKNITTNGEFYVCPVYNEGIAVGRSYEVYPIVKHWPIGTPEDLRSYLERERTS